MKKTDEELAKLATAFANEIVTGEHMDARDAVVAGVVHGYRSAEQELSKKNIKIDQSKVILKEPLMIREDRSDPEQLNG